MKRQRGYVIDLPVVLSLGLVYVTRQKFGHDASDNNSKTGSVEDVGVLVVRSTPSVDEPRALDQYVMHARSIMDLDHARRLFWKFKRWPTEGMRKRNGFFQKCILIARCIVSIMMHSFPTFAVSRVGEKICRPGQRRCFAILWAYAISWMAASQYQPMQRKSGVRWRRKMEMPLLWRKICICGLTTSSQMKLRVLLIHCLQAAMLTPCLSRLI